MNEIQEVTALANSVDPEGDYSQSDLVDSLRSVGIGLGDAVYAVVNLAALGQAKGVPPQKISAGASLEPSTKRSARAERSSYRRTHFPSAAERSSIFRTRFRSKARGVHSLSSLNMSACCPAPFDRPIRSIPWLVLDPGPRKFYPTCRPLASGKTAFPIV